MLHQKDAIVIESRFKSTRIGQSCVTYDQNIFPQAGQEIFSAAYWEERDAIIGNARGRGLTWFFDAGQQQLVLRHYYRGGLIGKLLTDQYFYTGLKSSRAFREFNLLNRLHALGLPVPRPVAFRVKKILALCCVSDIITVLIREAQSVAAILRAQPLSAAQWFAIGKTLRRFQHHHVYHHDLNAHNILLDRQQKAWLIDFDQGALRPGSNTWKSKNLQRLQRSLLKERQLHRGFHWREDDWRQLMAGYEQKIE